MFQHGGHTMCPKRSPIMHLIQASTFDSLIDIQSLIVPDVKVMMMTAIGVSALTNDVRVV